MNLTIPQKRSLCALSVKYAFLFMATAALALIAFGCCTGHPVFFLKWFFGLQADD